MEPLSDQILTMKVNEPLENIFDLPYYASLLRKPNFKTDYTHFSKLCLLKCIILLEKQNFWIFEHSDIRNESRWVNKNHIYPTQRWSLSLRDISSKIPEWPHLLSKTVISNVSFYFKNYIFEFFNPQVFVMKTNELIKTIF